MKSWAWPGCNRLEMRALRHKELPRDRGGVVRTWWTETAAEGESQLYRTEHLGGAEARRRSLRDEHSSLSV